jgi:tagatose-6-phosphate ketose/aldose isomerase
MTGTTRLPSKGVPPGDTVPPASVEEWLLALAGSGEIGSLLRASPSEQAARGYEHTLREICQQPVTWLETASAVLGRTQDLDDTVAGVGAVVLTGSGSSLYAGECVAPCLQSTLRLPVAAVAAGLILTHPEVCLPPSGPFLVVSLARSGDSPESRGVVDWLLECRPQARHLFITCNRLGSLATSYRAVPGVSAFVLDEKTHDRSLAMTSSFTNLVLAARGLGAPRDPRRCEARARELARAGARLLLERGDALAAAARGGFGSVAFLGSGCRLGSAREAALKMLELNAGEVWTMAESFLGLRHGPMSAVRRDTLIVAFLSSDPVVRAYEADLLRELDQKSLGAQRVLVGCAVPDDLASRPDDLVVDCGEEAPLADEDLTVVDAVVGQLLGFFRCLAAGHRPDSPSAEGVITRVVENFEIHRRDRPR